MVKLLRMLLSRVKDFALLLSYSSLLELLVLVTLLPRLLGGIEVDRMTGELPKVPREKLLDLPLVLLPQLPLPMIQLRVFPVTWLLWLSPLFRSIDWKPLELTLIFWLLVAANWELISRRSGDFFLLPGRFLFTCLAVFIKLLSTGILMGEVGLGSGGSTRLALGLTSTSSLFLDLMSLLVILDLVASGIVG